MVLRKDKIQALKDSLCLDNVDPATRSALNNLVDNLIPLFEATALPELGDLGGIDSGAGINPGDEADMLGGTPPLGGGEEMPFDDLGGFEDAPPGGGDDQGSGGGGGVGDPCADATSVNVTFLGETTEEIPAAENGIPGIGGVKIQEVVPENQLKLTDCRQKCVDDFGKDIKAIDEQITALQRTIGTVVDGFESTVRLSSKITPTPFLNAGQPGTIKLTGSSSDKIDELRRLKFEQEKLLNQCLAKCRKEDNKNNVGDEIVAGARIKDIGITEAKNISCEKIESGTQVIVSGTIIEPPGCGEGDLYVIVEACGCD